MRQRPIALTAVAALTLLALAAPASGTGQAPARQLASTPTTPAVSVTLAAPIAVRAKKTFTVRGTVGAPASPGESVTVQFLRKSGSWNTVTSVVTTLSASRGFKVKYAPGKTGHWRVVASIEASSSHLAANTTFELKVVGSKVVALTFDDGPWPTSTAKIIKALHDGDAQATFFTLGSQVGSRKALLKAEVDNRNAVGVHSWNHALMTKRTSAVNLADLKKCVKVVTSACGVTPAWFRPPYGATNAELKATAAQAGLRQVLWNVDTLDWKYRNTPSVVSRAVAGAHDGAIVLMHDGGGPRGATDAAVPIVIKWYRSKGYSFVTLDEMAALGYKVR